ncbi:hypothetical protein ACQPZ2_19030 [Nocardia pseudovaccinii]|uniref:hypothetical protein n=1 Tax=Nocardia pseudovaccinii TaxID=189540 RepID=UPI003D908A49
MVAAAVAVCVAFTGYLATYVNGVRLEQRKQRLSRVNQQLSELYGPLLALVEANKRVFNAFVERNGRPRDISIFEGEMPPTEGELAEWRLWVTTVFLPSIQAMRDVIVSHADLLLDPEMPPVLINLCAHVSGYEITASRWANGHYDEHRSVVAFQPEELLSYARHSFAQLKVEQGRLLGTVSAR